jgi:hypothetical protein
MRGLRIAYVDAIATSYRVRQATAITRLLGAWPGYLVADTRVCGFGAMGVDMVE